MNSPRRIHIQKIGIITVALMAAGGLIVWGYYTYSLNQQLSFTQDSFASTTAAFTKIIAQNREKIAKLEVENAYVLNSFTTEQRRRFELEKETQTQEKHIDTLTKLTTLDPELLKKYSKVYFLSENYVPPALDEITRAYVIEPDRNLMVLAQVAPFLNRMLEAANKDGIPLRVTSAYRSFKDQQQLKSGYKFTYGAGTANQFSAEQGYSEHQLGTTVDFTTPTLRGAELEFEKTSSFDWMRKNAHTYGFVLSYPRNNGYYQYEPWHWRFVGTALATELYNKNKYFYELDQREIEGYLLTIFD